MDITLSKAADVATIVAAIIALGAIWRWLVSIHSGWNPLKIKRFIYSRSNDSNLPAYFQVSVINNLPNDIVISNVHLMEKTKHEIRELDGRVEMRSLNDYVVPGSMNEGEKVIQAGARSGFVFEYDTTSQADKDLERMYLLSVRTNRGSYSFKLPEVERWEAKGGLLGYSDVATTSLGKYKSRLRYYWWKHCLSEETQKEFKLRKGD